MDAAAGDSVMNKMTEEACELYEEMAASHCQYHQTETWVEDLQGF